MDVFNKNIFDNQGISTEEKTLKLKIFDYFYYIIINKNKTSLIFLYIFHFLEAIQMISYAFSSPHLLTWKISSKRIRIINIITSGSRLSPLLQFVPFSIYTIIFIIFIILIFVYFLLLIIQIIFRKTNSKIYNKLLTFTHISIAPLTIIFYIPITELFLTSINCNFNEYIINNYPFKCWSAVHYIYIIVGIIFALIFLFCLLFLNFYYFYPFQTGISTIKLNSFIDIILLGIKFIFVFQNIIIKNEYISISILLILSFFLLFKEFSYPIYNINILELILNLRNIIVFWTFCMLFIAKLCLNSKINNLIFLLFFGYPIIIFSFIMFYKDNQNKFNYQNSSFNNINSCLTKVRFLTNLINSFIEDNKINSKYNENTNQKNDILLRGFIQVHTETCLKEDCPLTKFIKNIGNFNVQKQCLLNYMTFFFDNAIKKFPYSIILRLNYIHFNFYKKYNLNSVRKNLEDIKKIKYNANEEFILYCLEQGIMKMKLKDNNINDGNDDENESIIIEQNYKKLKDLISNTTKLYAEFWGIFATNITNNLNNSKIDKLGEKINKYLKEINNLWENNLKNKKIIIENENNAQLYSLFLREILWDQKKSELILKKINEEHNLHDYNKIMREKSKIENLDNIVENQDYTIIVNSDEKGRCKIIQFSNSLTYLIGYQKQEVINKPLEMLMPSIFIDGHSKKVEEYIKNYHLQKNIESFRGIEKNNSFILIKNKMGYIVPFNAKHTIYDDNDFSNSFMIKSKLEIRDPKSSYAYYILTKSDFSIESISSSSIHLGLTMDLLKKYVIKLNILIRNNKDKILNLFDRYKEYDDTKKIIWVYPNMIYPKNDILKNKNIPVQELIKISNKKKYNLQIFEMKYKEDEILGFVFKFTEINKKKNNKKEIVLQEFKPSNKNEIIFDLLNLNYIRTILVTKKTGFKNLREKKEEKNENKSNLSINITEKKKRKKTRENFGVNSISSEEESKIEISLTKERLLELQGRDSNEIKFFINLLPFYGNEISLIKHRPNKEKYPAGKAQEPLIKIDISNYIKRIEARIKENPIFLKKLKIKQKEEKININDNNNKSIKTNYISSVKQNENNNNEREDEIKSNFNGDNSFSLINIFNIKSIKIIKYVDFFIYIFSIMITAIEFILSYFFYRDNMNSFSYLSNSYDLLKDITYTKYIITEIILCNSMPNYLFSKVYEKELYIFYFKEELSKYREEISNIVNGFGSANIDFPKEYKNYISNTNITIKTLSNGIEKEEEQSFFSAINKLTTSLFYISTINNNSLINMNNTYSYELMVNLLDGYYIAFEKIIIILVNDFKDKAKASRIKNIIIFFICLFFSCFYLIIFWKIMKDLNNDREKPINLFLTIKKKNI